MLIYNFKRKLYKLKITKKIVFILIVIFNVMEVSSQSVMGRYISEGMENNEIIKQKSFDLKRSLYALKYARSLFYPSLSLETSYFKGEGGRTIDIPVGDLLNPIYRTLNQLSTSHMLKDISNYSIQLNPDNFYDAKFRLAFPVYNKEISTNYTRSQLLLKMGYIELQQYKRELVKNIKISYYQYCQVLKMIEIRQNILELIKNHHNIVKLLYENGKSNYTNVIRSEGEVKKAEEALFSVQQALKNSKAYFNFLLNRPFEEEIEVEPQQNINDIPSVEFLFQNKNVNKKEEIQKIKTVAGILQLNKKFAESYYFPKIETFLDLGSQAFDWKFDSESRYYFFGISLKWDFSLGGSNQYKIKEAQEEINSINSQSGNLVKLLELQLNNAKNAYEIAHNNYDSVLSQYKISEKYFVDVTKLYKEGVGLYIELLEAQHQYTNSILRLNISYFDIYIKQAEVEYASADFDLLKN